MTDWQYLGEAQCSAYDNKKTFSIYCCILANGEMAYKAGEGCTMYHISKNPYFKEKKDWTSRFSHMIQYEDRTYYLNV